MEKQARTQSTPHDTGRSQILRRIAAAILTIIVLSGLLFLSYSLVIQVQHTLRGQQANTMVANGSDRWVHDTQQTAPTFSSPAPPQIAVDARFQGYYSHQNGASNLGEPLTTAFPIRQGWIQFFLSGALLLPAPPAQTTSSASPAGDQIDALVSAGLADQRTGIVRLPLLQALLTVGSQVPVGGESSHLTYVDLRSAAAPAAMVPDPQGAKTPVSSPQSLGRQGVFIAGGTRDGQAVGHIIPAAIWNYMNRSDVSPDGWANDFGDPLTEALPFTVTLDGSVHHMLVQVFWRDALIVDQRALDASGQPTIGRLDTGVAYLRTVGPPAATLSQHVSIWALGDTAILSAPGTGWATAHIGQDFPLTLLGDAAWKTGMLWYHVQWRGLKTSGTGWAPAAALTFASPGHVPTWASFDILSPGLAQYLASQGNNAAAVVYDVTRQQYYTYNVSGRFIMGSSMKVPIMLTFLSMTESEGREPDDTEMGLLTAMIEHSDNDAASTLYYNKIGGAQGVANFLQQVGISDLDPDPAAWGYSTVTPLAMVNLLTLLHDGKVLTAQDRSLALNLMEHIESDQQVGVGDTAPDGATVAMKDGWLQGPDNLWAMNSSGIVTLGQETYIIAVYTAEQNTLQDGQAIARQVCSMVAMALT
jgi:beta-lactamase class A